MTGNKKGKFYIFPILIASLLDKIVYYSSLTLFKTNLKKKAYKSYIKYRLKNFR